jgi:hypothetical protein
MPFGRVRDSVPIQIFLKIPFQSSSKRFFPQKALTHGAIEPPRLGKDLPQMGPHLGESRSRTPPQARKIMIARFWGKTAVPRTMRQAYAIAFDFFLPRPGWF